MRILVVEQEAAEREQITGLLSVYGDCDTAAGGAQAVEEFRQALENNDPYDMVCFDIIMPGKDGYQVIKEVRDIEKEKGVTEDNRVKLVVISEINVGNNVKKAFDLGCDAYAGKPVNPDKFAAALKKLNIIKDSAE